MAALKLNCYQLTFGNRLVCRSNLITIANTAVGCFLCLTLSCNIQRNFGSGFFNSLFKGGYQSVPHHVVIFAIYAVLDILLLDFSGGVFHVEADLAKQSDIFWFTLLIFASYSFFFFFVVSCSLISTNEALERKIYDASFIVLV